MCITDQEVQGAMKASKFIARYDTPDGVTASYVDAATIQEAWDEASRNATLADGETQKVWLLGVEEVTAPLEFRHTDRGVWSADASDLGLAPGDFPEEIVARVDSDDVRARLVAHHRDSGGELTHVEYAPYGRKFRLLVWND